MIIEIIPAIDLMDGRCVRLRQGDFQQQTVYSDDPLTVARSFREAGLQRLHLVDLDGARGGAPRNLDVLRSIAAGTDLQIDFSGGVRTDSDLKEVFDAGAAFVGIGSLAVRNPEILRAWVATYGADRFLIGADVRDGRLAVNGWEQRTELGLFSFIEMMLDLGLQDIFCTDVAVDGMMAGPSINLYRDVLARFPSLRLVASGGVRNLDDVGDLEQAGCRGVIVGKALYEGGISLEAVTEKLARV